MDRLLVLTRIIDELGPIKGERCLQKLVYILQSRSIQLGYPFTWNMYGPSSKRLQADITEAVELGLIEIHMEGNIPIYRASKSKNIISSYWKERNNAFAPPALLMSKIKEIQQFLGEKLYDPITLEIIASLDYLSKKEVADPISRLIEQSNGRFTQQTIHTITSSINNSILKF